ncbi:urea carboxylase [Gloeobacter morelensis]|uniref:Urea carboxylase n=1 Tax=Gloeobacter morelensis MG652769 TaxID=2781736 RepID=A0ABY3PJ27_9CYAN|nr:urea carboxylase [Gloeobacter morelensis]UFP93665.1 urea carboxylase [Gloeobacter morelensis MG652769]
MFDKVLIANRGEIACRILRTLDRLGIASVAVYSEADACAPHVQGAGEAIPIGPAPVAQSYLRYERILEAAVASGAQAIHPGYGFLSESAEFAEACERENIVFIGPTPTQMRRFGRKHTARALAAANGVALLPGTGLLADLVEARRQAAAIGYPVMLKSTAGGGGIGLALCRSEAKLTESFQAVQRLSENNFRDGGVYLEKYVEHARHLEVQIFGDGEGRLMALGERDCSIQRRNQKLLEETPAPGIGETLRERLCEAAVRLGQAVNYRSAGTVEFIYDAEAEAFYFLEVNTRLQVEHGVTEAVAGIDLVEWMVRLAAGERAFLEAYQHRPRGHAVEVRLYAEDAGRNFQPSTGTLTEAVFPAVRCDSWVEQGTEVTPYYDPLLAKLIVRGESRPEAVTRLQAALADTRIAGVETNLDYLRQILADADFLAGNLSTRFLQTFHYAPLTVEVLEPGTHSTLQDYPGRTGYWNIGVPPSGPMDPLAFRLANRLVGNPPEAAGLECTALGPTLRFHTDAVICLCGAAMDARLDGEPVPCWRAVPVAAGSTLRLGAVTGPGYRTYLAVRGGFDVPEYLGSRATFTLGQFGGHCGRTLRAGDVLRLVRPAAGGDAPPPLAASLIPEYRSDWEIGVLYGPHGAPDFFTDQDIETFFVTAWEVHYNSARTGVRLTGPKPVWARADGGEAGLHPSNIHDNAYAVGTVDFTGDMPVILGPDGPSLGGFVCPATVARAELWKIGQLKPGDTVRFRRLGFAEALRREQAQDLAVETLSGPTQAPPAPAEADDPAVLHAIQATAEQIAVVYRQSGDKYLLIEYGPPVLDLNLRLRVHALMEWLQANALPGMLELTPGIRSLQVHFDGRVLPRERLLEVLTAAESQLPPIEAMEVPTRILHLPLSWEDESTLLAIRKYMQSVRKDAPWCPSNIEFIRRINGLTSVEDVKRIVFEASYLVLGLGDVYLGAPVATPIDPRHRLVTTKYNPARTWTPENAVGIGGAYLCIYGMEGPGGYQFVGRTVQVWNRYRQTADFTRPWLLRFFDQIRFYPVSGPELLRLREDFRHGRAKLEVSEAIFSLKQYNDFLAEIAPEAAAFKARQQAAFAEERERWRAAGEFAAAEDPAIAPPAAEEYALPAGACAVSAQIAANVWQIAVQPGEPVAAGDPLVILESMKMEFVVTSPISGAVLAVRCAEGQLVSSGQTLVVVKPSQSVPP